MGGIIKYVSVDGHVCIAATDGTAVARNDTCGKLVLGSNRTLYLQVLNDSINSSVLEKRCIVVRGVHVDFDGVSCTIEGTLVGVFAGTDHCTADTSVNVGCQHGIGFNGTVIYEHCELFQVCSRTNLIDAARFGERPRSCADNAHQRSHTQIQ